MDLINLSYNIGSVVIGSMCFDSAFKSTLERYKEGNPLAWLILIATCFMFVIMINAYIRLALQLLSVV